LLEVAVDELDGLEQAPRRLGLPDLAEAAAAQAFQEAVARDGLGSSFDPHCHEVVRDEVGTPHPAGGDLLAVCRAGWCSPGGPSAAVTAPCPVYRSTIAFLWRPRK